MQTIYKRFRLSLYPYILKPLTIPVQRGPGGGVFYSVLQSRQYITNLGYSLYASLQYCGALIKYYSDCTHLVLCHAQQYVALVALQIN